MVFFLFPWSSEGSDIHGCGGRASSALLQGCGAAAGRCVGGENRVKPEKNPSELLSSPSSVNGRDTSPWELQWGMVLAEGVGRSERGLTTISSSCSCSFQL